MNYRCCMMLIGSKSGKNGSKTQNLEKIQGTAWYRKYSVFLFRPVFVL